MEAAISEPWPKRKRVVRACDRCRVKKAKCDGGQPCAPCLAYDNPTAECTFQRALRHKGPLYVEELESRVRLLESSLSILCPDIDLNALNLKSTLLPRRQAGIGEDSTPKTPNHDLPGTANGRTRSSEATDEKLLNTIIEVTGRLELDKQGNYEYYEPFASFTFLRRAQEQCKRLLGVPLHTDFCLSSPPLWETPKDTGSGQKQRPAARLESVEILPAWHVAKKLVSSALKDACCLIRFVHGPTFDQSLGRIYEINPENYKDQDLKFLPLLYIILAVGVLASSDGAGNLTRIRLEGSKYFRAGQCLVNATNCRDRVSLQAIMAMVFYLQSVGEISTCYSYISVALASSLRMGFHRSDAANAFDLIERETRKRMFWILRTMETYITTLLGLPKLINDEDIDQEQLLEVDDEFITAGTIMPMPRSHAPAIAATIAHVRLTTILTKVVQSVYVSKDSWHARDGLCQVDYTKVAAIEKELEQWCQQLPPVLTRSRESTMSRDHILLQIAHGHVQMILYRPFLRSALGRPTNDSESERSSACAIACVTAARQVVLLLEQLQDHGFLNGSYWFTIYTLYSAVLWLLVYILSDHAEPDMPAFVQAARSARRILCGLAPRSAIAERCATSLSPLFEELAITHQDSPRKATWQLDSSKLDDLEGLMQDPFELDLLGANLDVSLDPAHPRSLEGDARGTTILPNPGPHGVYALAEPPTTWEPEPLILKAMTAPQNPPSIEYNDTINPLLLTRSACST